MSDLTLPKVTRNLMAARKLIENPEHWTIIAWNRDKCGIPTQVKETAYSHCSLGALYMIGVIPRYLCSSHYNKPEIVCITEAVGIKPSSLGFWNDNHAHAEVLSAWDKAIALSLTKEKATV